MRVIRLKQGPRGYSDSNTVGYRLTMTEQPDGRFRGRWDYPRQPEHPSISGSFYSLKGILSNVKAGKWAYDVPECIAVPEGL